TRGDEILAEVFLPADEKNIVIIKEDNIQLRRLFEAFMARLRDLDLSLSYLPDDRKMESPFHTTEDPITLFGGLDTSDYVLHTRLARVQHAEQQSVLDTAVRRAEETIRSSALQAATSGEADTNKIYADV